MMIINGMIFAIFLLISDGVVLGGINGLIRLVTGILFYVFLVERLIDQQVLLSRLGRYEALSVCFFAVLGIVLTALFNIFSLISSGQKVASTFDFIAGFPVLFLNLGFVGVFACSIR